MTDPDRSGRRRSLIVVAIVLVLALAGAGAWFLVNDSSASASVTLVPAKSPGPDPFTASVAIGPAVSFPGNVQAIAATDTAESGTDARTGTHTTSGTAPGLYGGSGDARICDPQQLVQYLAANPAKARAWASVFGIRPAGVDDYVGRLTPLVLTRDTLVTNHGYRDGAATAFQAVLQAGTAVLVDTRGVPRVKCGCGNPLAPPAQTRLPDADTTGAPWPGYAPETVTVVRPGAPTDSFGTIDTTTGEPATVPAGGGSGGVFAIVKTADLVNSSEATIATSTDGEQWTDVGRITGQHVLSLAFGNGTWVAATSVGQAGESRILTSTDLVRWSTAVDYPRTMIQGVGFGDGRFTAVGNDFSGTGGGAVALTSTDGTHWSPTTPWDGAFGIYPSSVAYGQGHWLAVGGQGNRGLPLFMTSTDGIEWTSADSSVGATNVQLIAFGGNRWELAGDGWFTSSDGTTWTQVTAGTGPKAFAYGNGTWLAATVSGGELGTNSAAASTRLSESTDGTSWSLSDTMPTAVTAMAFGSTGGTLGTDGTPSTPASSASGAPADGSYLLVATGYEGCQATNPFSTMTVKGNRVTLPYDGTQLTGTMTTRADGAPGFVINARTPRLGISVTILGTMLPGGSFTATSAVAPQRDQQVITACQPTIQGARTGAGGSTTTTKRLPTAEPCDPATIARAAATAYPELTFHSVIRCDAGWAALGVSTPPPDVNDVNGRLRWDGRRWIRGECDDPAMPADIVLISCFVN